MPRHGLTNDQWACIEDLLPRRPTRGRPQRDRREIIDAILWILRSGAPWRDLPKEFGPWQTARDLFNKWNGDGTLDAVLRRLIAAHVDVGEIDAELWCVDGSTVRAARCAAGGGKKVSLRSLTTTH